MGIRALSRRSLWVVFEFNKIMYLIFRGQIISKKIQKFYTGPCDHQGQGIQFYEFDVKNRVPDVSLKVYFF